MHSFCSVYQYGHFSNIDYCANGLYNIKLIFYQNYGGMTHSVYIHQSEIVYMKESPNIGIYMMYDASSIFKPPMPPVNGKE